MIIVDFLPHDREFLRTEHAHRRLGVSDQTIRQWAAPSRLEILSMDHLEADAQPPGGVGVTMDIGLWSLAKAA